MVDEQMTDHWESGIPEDVPGYVARSSEVACVPESTDTDRQIVYGG